MIPKIEIKNVSKFLTWIALGILLIAVSSSILGSIYFPPGKQVRRTELKGTVAFLNAIEPLVRSFAFSGGFRLGALPNSTDPLAPPIYNYIGAEEGLIDEALDALEPALKQAGANHISEFRNQFFAFVFGGIKYLDAVLVAPGNETVESAARSTWHELGKKFASSIDDLTTFSPEQSETIRGLVRGIVNDLAVVLLGNSEIAPETFQTAAQALSSSLKKIKELNEIIWDQLLAKQNSEMTYYG